MDGVKIRLLLFMQNHAEKNLRLKSAFSVWVENQQM